MHTIINYGKKIAAIGLRKSAAVVYNRMHLKWHANVWRQQYKWSTTTHSWSNITRAHHYNNDITSFLASYKDRSLPFITNAPLLKRHRTDFIQKADAYEKNCFAILGSKPQCFTQIPWHTDIRLQQQNHQSDCHFDPAMWYTDITIRTGTDKNNLGKDIKVPWELSRFKHGVILAHAYRATNNEYYVHALVNQIHDWLDHNQYLHGVNWVCPMEVALRAVNWIVALELCKNSTVILADRMERIITSLYDHMIYLEGTWELYDGRTSNHYLADLLGYWYLCWFFKDLPGITDRRNWCYRVLMQEFEKQIFGEGTSYEGSTAYHCLVTEMWVHMYQLCTVFKLPFPSQMMHRLHRMRSFIDWIHYADDAYIMIGDNDSGRVCDLDVTSFELSDVKIQCNNGVRSFLEFGLSIVKIKNWHITLRHHAYQAHQPTGHFHNDWASITLSYNNIPIIIDPGTYVYTACQEWRNYYRSIAAHSSFFIDGYEPIILSDQLFGLPIPEKKDSIIVMPASNNYVLATSHDFYRAYGLSASRTIMLDDLQGQVAITDTWHMHMHHATYMKSVWQFVLAPMINAIYNNGQWELWHNNRLLLIIVSPQLCFSVIKRWVAPEYGVQVETSVLCASQKVIEEPVLIFIQCV